MFFSPFTLELYQGGKRDQLENKAIVISFTALFGAVLKGAFGFWVTASPASFHDAGTCDMQNGVKLFMVGQNFNITTPFFRYFWMAAYASALLLYAVPFLYLCHQVLKMIMEIMLSGNQPDPPGIPDPSFGPMMELGTTGRHSSPKVFATGVIITALAIFLFPVLGFLSVLLSAAATREVMGEMVQEIRIPATLRRLIERTLRLMRRLLRLMETPLRLIETPLRLIGWRVLGEKWFLCLCGLLLPAGSVIGWIISTELTIKANAGLVRSGENQWSLAQTLAMFLVLPNAYMVLKCAWVIVKALRNPRSRDTSSGMGEEGHRDGMPQLVRH